MGIIPNLVIGYHGCSYDTARKIFEGEIPHLSPSTNDYDWLGHGIYFWENDYKRARKWAENTKKEPAVIGAIILPNNCLDLLQQEQIDILRLAYNSYKEGLILQGIKEKDFPKNEEGFKGDKDLLKRELDCQVINYLHNNVKELKISPFDSVRAAFLEGKAIFPGSKLMEKSHIQWAIRNPEKCILGYFRPFKDLA